MRVKNEVSVSRIPDATEYILTQILSCRTTKVNWTKLYIYNLEVGVFQFSNRFPVNIIIYSAVFGMKQLVKRKYAF